MCEQKITQPVPPCKLLRFVGYIRYCPGFRERAIPTLNVSPESLKFMSHYQLRHIELVFKGPSDIPAKFHDFSVMLTNLKDSHDLTIVF